MSPYPKRHFVSVVAATVTAILAIVLAPGGSAAADPGRDEIYRRLGVDQVPADYVILVDTSGSMRAGNLYAGVRATLSSFLAGLTDKDYVALFTFNSTATPRYLGPAGDPARMLADVPATPEGGSTDIGKAVEEAVEELERPGAAAVASVVLITDGEHDPGTPTDYPNATGPAWQSLSERAGRLKAESIKGYALPLNGAAGGALLGSVIKDTETLDPSSVAQLGDYLDRSKAGARLGKARIKLAPDGGKGVTASWDGPAETDLSATDARVTLTLHADTTVAPLTVTGLDVGYAGGPSIVGDLPDHIELEPGETRTFPLALSWPGKPWIIPFHDERTSSGPLTVTGTVAAPWAAELKPDVDLATPASIQGTAPEITVRSRSGTWLAQAGVVALVVLLLLLAVLVAYLRRRAVQSGTLVAISPMTGEELGRFRLSGRSTRVTGQRLVGEGSVVARRVPRRHDNTDGIEYEITYRRLDRTHTTRLPSRGTVLVGGIAFEHQPG